MFKISNNNIGTNPKFKGKIDKNILTNTITTNTIKKMPVISSDFIKTYNNINVANNSKSYIDFDKLKALNITNYEQVGNLGIRGESLSASRNYKFLPKIKENGINTVIDLRTADYTEKFEKKCKKFGLNYLHIPIDAKTTPAKDIIKNLPKLFKTIEDGNFYIACAQGRHRTDIALAMNYLFNPKTKEIPRMYGHVKNGKMRYEDIFTRANSIMREITPEYKAKLGWTEEFEQGFKQRKQNLVKFNED